MTATRTSLKSEVAVLQTLSRLFHLVQFVKCWQFFLDLNSKTLIKVQEKKKQVVVLCSRPPQDVKLRISRGSRAVAAKKCTKKRDAREKCQSKPIRSTLGSNLSSASDVFSRGVNVSVAKYRLFSLATSCPLSLQLLFQRLYTS